MENSLKSSAINYGLYLGLFLVAATIIAYAVKLDLLVEMWYGIAILLGVIVFGIISVAKSKSLLNGFISFKEAFTSYFLTVIIGLFISTIVSFLLFNVIDPEAAETLKQMTIEATITGMERWNVPAENIAKQVETLENQNQFGLSRVFMALLWQILIFSVIGLIVAVSMKKSDPDNA